MESDGREMLIDTLNEQTTEVRANFYEIVFGDILEYHISNLDDEAFKQAQDILENMIREYNRD